MNWCINVIGIGSDSYKLQPKIAFNVTCGKMRLFIIKNANAKFKRENMQKTKYKSRTVSRKNSFTLHSLIIEIQIPVLGLDKIIILKFALNVIQARSNISILNLRNYVLDSVSLELGISMTVHCNISLSPQEQTVR